MASHHKHAPWRKVVLVPFWIVQIFCMLCFIAIFAYLEEASWRPDEDGDVFNDDKYVKEAVLMYTSL